MMQRDEQYAPDGSLSFYIEWPDTVDGDVDVNGTVRPMTADEVEEWRLRAGTIDLNVKRRTVEGAVETLRQWAEDARVTTVTSGNAVAVLNVVVDRLGVFFDRFADLIETRGA